MFGDDLDLSIFVDEDVIGPDISDFVFHGVEPGSNFAQGVDEVPKLVFVESSIFGVLSIFDFVFQVEGIKLVLGLDRVGCTLMLPEEPHMPAFS